MKIRDFVGAISRANAERGMTENFRKLLAGGAAIAKRNPAKLVTQMSGISRMAALADREFERWAEPEEIGTPEGRKIFDVCDLRIWLDIAARADVAAIPAKEVARLEEAELEALLGTVPVPEEVRKRYMDGVRTLSAQAGDDTQEAPQMEDIDVAEFGSFIEGLMSKPDRGAGARGWAKIEGALDDIPASWMVRTHVAGSGNLKALVGTGLMHKADDTATVREGFEIGGGWVRAGNRRIIDFADPRFLDTAIGGHKPGVIYLARPWAEADRFHEGEDLHRANSPLAGPGKWPAEWRVFIRGGEVTGAANYYGWTGQGAGAQNAWNAIRSAALGQKMADCARDLGLVGAFMDQVFIRSGEHKETIDALDRGWPEDRLTATLDFYEAKGGLLFLEGGPGHMPGGGGHPCAFAGQGTQGHPMFDVARCEGVAYRCMPHVSLADPRSWKDGDAAGCIEGWAAAAERAVGFADLDADMISFLARRGVDVSVDPSPSP